MIEPVSLVEREEQLASLRSLIDGGKAFGSTVLLSGEAGFGKTSLLRAFLGELDHRHRILEAACEPVGIPTAFAPLFDLLDELPAELRSDIRSGAGRTAVYAGMLDLLRSDRVILVIEDVHWADEATLGLIRYLGRRIAPTGSLLIVTYRSEELDLAHPLHLVIADLGPQAVRVDLPALTQAGVETMTQGLEIDARRVHAVTLGNPFLVEEVIRHPDARLPATISNAVLARVANFSADALQTVYLVALCPDGVALDLLVELDPAAGGYVDLAVQRRLLVSAEGQVTSRHDLIRESLERAVPPALKRDLHLRLLERLERQADDQPDISRLAYHSLGAFDAERVVRYSLRAAENSARGGAHRQAARHYANALRFREKMPVELTADTLLAAAHEHCLTNAFDEACAYASERVAISEGPLEVAKAQAWLAYFLSRRNDLPGTREFSARAVEVLETEPASEELALALGVRAWASMIEGDLHDSIELGNRAIEVARTAGSARVEIHAAASVGISLFLLGDLSGQEVIGDAIRLGLEREAEEWTARAMNNLGLTHMWAMNLVEARDHFLRLIEYTTAGELDAWYIAGTTTLAYIDLAAGRLDDADAELTMVLGQKTCRQTEHEALIVAATLSARRGLPASELRIESAIDQARGSLDWDMVLSAALLALEGAWMGLHDLSEALHVVDELDRFEVFADDHWGRSMLGFWALRTGADILEGRIRGPAALESEGRFEEAAEAWDRGGYVMEATITRAMTPDADLDQIFSKLSTMGAEGVARGLRRELQRRGVRGVPRGERNATRAHPAGLTARQAEVLALMQAGLSNAAIAETLYISEKTAGHHVSAILAKLNVSSRLQAVAVTTGDVGADSVS